MWAGSINTHDLLNHLPHINLFQYSIPKKMNSNESKIFKLLIDLYKEIEDLYVEFGAEVAILFFPKNTFQGMIKKFEEKKSAAKMKKGKKCHRVRKTIKNKTK